MSQGVPAIEGNIVSEKSAEIIDKLFKLSYQADEFRKEADSFIEKWRTRDPPEVAEVPPHRWPFSITSVSRPCSAAVIAEVSAPAPEPTMSKSVDQSGSARSVK